MTSSHTTPLLNARGFTAMLARSEIPVAVAFGAAWCSPCRQLQVVLEEVAPRFAGRVAIARVDVDASGDLAEEHSVRLVPTLLIVVAGRVVVRMQGRICKDELVAALNKAAVTD